MARASSVVSARAMAPGSLTQQRNRTKLADFCSATVAGFYAAVDNGRMRDELLNESLFLGLDHARSRIAHWVTDYNQRRPHSALGYLTPAAYAATLTATSDRLRNPDKLRRSPVAIPAPCGAKSAGTLIAAG